MQFGTVVTEVYVVIRAWTESVEFATVQEGREPLCNTLELKLAVSIIVCHRFNMLVIKCAEGPKNHWPNCLPILIQ